MQLILRQGQTVDPNTADLEPSLTLPHQWVDDGFMEQMARKLDPKFIEPESHERLKGELEATKKHLTDMRRIVMKKEGIDWQE